jgi:hypothetical protein
MKFEGSFSPRAGLADSITVTTGAGGMFECINPSSYNLVIFIPTLGNTLQLARTQAIYPLINAELGSQTINIQARNLAPLQVGELGIAPNFSNAVYFNSYQRGERELYAPFTLSDFVLPASYSNVFSATGTGAAGLTLTIPAASPTAPLTHGYNVITSFDVSASSASIGHVTMTVTGLISETANYLIEDNPTEAFVLNKEFPAPGVIGADLTPVVFTIPGGLASGVLTINVYFYQVFN